MARLPGNDRARLGVADQLGDAPADPVVLRAAAGRRRERLTTASAPRTRGGLPLLLAGGARARELLDGLGPPVQLARGLVHLRRNQGPVQRDLAHSRRKAGCAALRLAGLGARARGISPSFPSSHKNAWYTSVFTWGPGGAGGRAAA